MKKHRRLLLVWKKKAEKYREAFEITETRVNQIISENEKLNHVVTERSNLTEVQEQTIKDYEEKLTIMIEENNKLNDIIQTRIAEPSIPF